MSYNAEYIRLIRTQKYKVGATCCVSVLNAGNEHSIFSETDHFEGLIIKAYY
jgi:hypothetical protein